MINTSILPVCRFEAFHLINVFKYFVLPKARCFIIIFIKSHFNKSETKMSLLLCVSCACRCLFNKRTRNLRVIKVEHKLYHFISGPIDSLVEKYNKKKKAKNRPRGANFILNLVRIVQ